MPTGWYPIDLDASRTRASIEAILKRQFGGRRDLPQLRRELRSSLASIATQARENGGVQVWLSLDLINGIPLAGVLVVTVVPPPPGVDPKLLQPGELLEALRQHVTASGTNCDYVHLRLGQAIRGLHLVTPDEASPPPALPSTTMQVHVPIPDSSALLLLTFSTPLPSSELLDSYIELFDAIAGAARWVA